MPETRTPLQIHRCRFVEYVPSAINALSFVSKDVKRPLLACARANGDIEIWNPITWHCERTIPGITGAGAIESIVWIPVKDEPLPEDDQDSDEDDSDKKKRQSSKRWSEKQQLHTPRLFTAGLDGFMTEWDLVALAPISRVESGGGAIWSMAVSPSGKEIAIGCEDGCVRVFEIAPVGSSDCVVYKAACDRQDNRILSVAYHPTKPIVSAGSSDSCIRNYSTENFRLISRLTVDTGKRHEETLIWTLLYLSNGTLVSGDSIGAVSFFDNESNTLIKSIKSHYADVLCLAGGSNGEVLYSSGVDRRVIQYKLVDNTIQNQATYMSNSTTAHQFKQTWVLSGDRRFHSHDVRALALCEMKPIDALVSGGMDTTFVISRTISQFPDSKQERQSPFPQRALVNVATEARLLIARFDDTVKVWALGQSVGNLEDFGGERVGERVAIAKKERLVAELKIKTITNLISSAISADGSLIAVSDLFCTRLFVVSLEPSRVTRLKKFPSPSVIPGSVNITFTPDSKRMILAGTDSIIRVVDVSNQEFKIVADFTEHRGKQQKGRNPNAMEGVEVNGSAGRFAAAELVSSLAVSADGQWLASGDLAKRINIYNLDVLKHHATIPQLQSQHTFLSFNVNSANLIVTLNSNEIFVYDAEHARLTDWSRQNSHTLPAHFLQRTDKIMGAGSCESAPHKFVVWGANYLASVDTSKSILHKSSSNKRKMGAKKTATDKKASTNGRHSSEVESVSSSTKPETKGAFSIQFHYGPTMFFGFLAGGQEAVVVERPVLSVMDSLPAGFYRKTFSA
ncbi:UNVERIFIED_CONTAM: U3 small nucleolar RNA-associated protein [Siphonaria sp. JEL0065]|nr:U3 small nucleolar RNA-associated protein [Siphonaria sp. JEL0065]